jgi:hypothetical protein
LRSIEAAYIAFLKQSGLKDADPIKLKDIRRAYYHGAGDAVMVCGYGGRMTKTRLDNAKRWLKSLTAFANQEAKHGT